ncbi:substrate-binding periplasmic protein [Paucibacter soli]|uniref:substrate-binding periplasmic protein n=1 Tax=Paucibacter soli TaxID=3133433 RepID=UPI0030B79C0E
MLPRHLIASLVFALLGLSSPALQALRMCAPILNVEVESASARERFARLEAPVREAARNVGLGELEITRMPAARCRLETEQGKFDVLIASFTSADTANFELPLRHGQLDPERRVLSVDFVLIRRRGSPADWDGGRFSRVQRVGLKRGVPLLVNALRSHAEIEIDDLSFTAEQLLRKLAAGRIDLALVMREEYEVARSGTESRLEVLAHPFANMDIYLGFSKKAPPELLARAPAWWEQVAEQLRHGLAGRR